MSAIRIVLVDDHAIVREGLRTVLEDGEMFTVVGEGSRAADAVRLAAAERPDVMILDISMPGGSGLQAVPELLEVSPSTRILMLSVHDDQEYVMECVRSGAHGYLRKDSTPAELREAVQAVHGGGVVYSPAIARQLAEAVRSGAAAEPAPPDPSVLTPREREVLVRIAQGMANKEIAAALQIATRTVEAHRDSLGKKLGMRSVAALTRYCVKHQLGVNAPGGA